MSTGMEKGIKYSQDQLSIITRFEHDFRHNAVVLRAMLKTIQSCNAQMFEYNVSNPTVACKVA